MLFVEYPDRPISLRLLGEQHRLTMGLRRTRDHADCPDLALVLALADQPGEAANLVGAEPDSHAGDVDHLAIGAGTGRIDAEDKVHHVLRLKLTLGDSNDQTTGMGNAPRQRHVPYLS